MLDRVSRQDGVRRRRVRKQERVKNCVASAITQPPPFLIPCICIKPNSQESSAQEAITADSTAQFSESFSRQV